MSNYKKKKIHIKIHIKAITLVAIYNCSGVALRSISLK